MLIESLQEDNLRCCEIVGGPSDVSIAIGIQSFVRFCRTNYRTALEKKNNMHRSLLGQMIEIDEGTAPQLQPKDGFTCVNCISLKCGKR